MNFNDLIDVHETQMNTDRQVLKVFWSPENDNETIGEMKKLLKESYMKSGVLPILEDCEKRHRK